MKAIIFDFDGVIHDTFDIVYKANQQLPDNHLSEESFKDLFNGNMHQSGQIKPENDKKYFELQAKAFEGLKIRDDIKHELLQLKKKYLLFIVTSNQEWQLERYFQENDLHGLFTEILGFETHKLKVDKFNMLFKKHKLKKKDSLFVTDTLGDIKEAHNVGIKTIAVEFGYHERHRLERGNPWKIVSSFKEIRPAIEEFFSQQ